MKNIKLRNLFTKGIAVFGSEEEFKLWLSKPAFGLRNMTPQELIETTIGIDLVDEELDRIAYGDVL